MKSLVLLLLILLSACNEDGITTLVIEDGQQPSVAQMIIGKWKPNRLEMIDENGNVLERPDISDMPELNIDENGTGYWGNNANESNLFEWNIDEGEYGEGMGGYNEKGPSITLGGERWYIFQLTKSILIIYRVTDRYIIIYYYYRVGEYNTSTPSQEIARISKIEGTTYYVSSGDKKDFYYTFVYDDQGRIKEFNSDGEKYDYIYEGTERVLVSTNGLLSYIGEMDSNVLQELYSVSDTYQEPIATFKYNNEGYLSTLNNMVCIYEQGNLKEIKINDSVFDYEYSNEKNNANIDLNCIIGYFVYNHQPYTTLFAPFGFYGKCSTNLQSKEVLPQGSDFYFEYVYENDSKGRISMITRKCLDVYRIGNVFNTTIFKIYYNE